MNAKRVEYAGPALPKCRSKSWPESSVRFVLMPTYVENYRFCPAIRSSYPVVVWNMNTYTKTLMTKSDDEADI